MDKRVLSLAACALAVACSREPQASTPPQSAPAKDILNEEPPPAFLRMNHALANRTIVKGVDDSPQGSGWRWTRESAELRFVLPKPEGWRATVEFGIPEVTFKQTGPVTIAFRVNNQTLDRVKYSKPGDYKFDKPVPPAWIKPPDATTLSIDINPPYVAADDGVRLGMVLHAAGFQPQRSSDMMSRMGSTAPHPVDLNRLIIESATQYALYFADAGGIIQTWSGGCERVHGYSAADAIGKHISMLYRQADVQAGVPQAELNAAAANGSAHGRRFMLRAGREEFWAEGVLSAARSPAGELLGFSCVMHDASERHNLELALERSTEELQRFAFAVSHDLQEPLRNVGNYAELLARRYRGRLDSDADDFIRYMTDGVTRIGQLLKDILAYSQAGREDRTRPEPSDAANILQWALMNLDGLVKQYEAVITYDSLPTVHVDQMQLATVFQQLLGNSLKFRSDEAPRIHISAEPVSGNMWLFSIRDNGIGVQPDHTERIFGVFKRLHGRDVPGTGIGLAICRKIVEAHRGKIWMESQANEGATVKFTLPAA